MRTFLSSFTKRVTSSSVVWKQSQQLTSTRSISVGTNLIEKGSSPTSVTLQKSRPWYMNDTEGSNSKIDNEVSMKELFDGKTVAMFGVPAPFTGTCTNEHYPGYKALVSEFAKVGVTDIICYAVSDPYAHNAWSNGLQNDPNEITFLADPDASFAKTFKVDGMTHGKADAYANVSLGPYNCIRFSTLVVNGIVQSFHIVEDATKDAEVLLEDAKQL